MRPGTLDTLLAQAPPANAAALQRALAGAREELALKRPVRRWRTQAAWVFAVPMALVLVTVGILLVAGQTSLPMLLGRGPLFALLWLTAGVCAWGALSPHGRQARRVGIALSAVSAAVLVLGRATPHAAPTLSGWVCTASHAGVALLPMAVALLTLRSAAFHPLRALNAGLAVGTAGALVGELACTQDWRHVAGYHLSAWALVAGVSLALSRFLKPRSFAP
ncbi:DUF1109 domain-containing protein [Stigmatella hybrida]|uniref:DUF1109 domain-containing protein n=1 Tax=Stigmatella hybrida TaxID=394097 RepID=UPI001CDABED2|nr:DUF1109 domain-containing protein [Stigmatella hybrida]